MRARVRARRPMEKGSHEGHDLPPPIPLRWEGLVQPNLRRHKHPTKILLLRVNPILDFVCADRGGFSLGTVVPNPLERGFDGKAVQGDRNGRPLWDVAAANLRSRSSDDWKSR